MHTGWQECHVAVFKVATSGLSKPREIPPSHLVPFCDPAAQQTDRALAGQGPCGRALGSGLERASGCLAGWLARSWLSLSGCLYAAGSPAR